MNHTSKEPGVISSRVNRCADCTAACKTSAAKALSFRIPVHLLALKYKLFICKSSFLQAPENLNLIYYLLGSIQCHWNSVLYTYPLSCSCPPGTELKICVYFMFFNCLAVRISLQITRGLGLVLIFFPFSIGNHSIAEGT
jgi:hypothetical protein